MTSKFISNLISHLVANNPKISILNVIREAQVGMARTEANKNIESYIYLAKIPLEKCTLLHDGEHRHGVMTTNISEAHDSILKKARVSLLKA
ncbi:hypothetical protein M9H77_35782 [Catharanthus roseus]|uniref:Uncharacterized protein n=1 Tax=Catharanthus roseus TaxID=4058 RepID=A0ACB9ZPZ5_CATRO|nr:hypothetical protein M9H77_35782 [Catharanthus roseus]